MASVLQPPVPIAPAYPREKRWTRGEVARMAELGFFEGQAYELVDGRLVSTMSKGRQHFHSLMLLLEALRAIFGNRYLNHETSIDVNVMDNETNEPQPDVIVLKRSTFEILGNPQPSDIALVAEISYSSLAYDLRTKAAVYARADIKEYWVLDVEGRRLIVHRDPEDGVYQSVVAYHEETALAPLAASDKPVRVNDLLLPE